MKKFFFAAALACLALFTACEKSGVDHTGDKTGKIYGRWALDTKNVVVESTTDGKTKTETSDTDFSADHFYLLLAEPQVALAKEGTLLTFDIDDVDGGTFSYNADTGQISFNKMLRLSKGFVDAHVMTLYGTFDVLELTDAKLVIQQTQKVTLGDIVDAKQTTTYSFHRLAEKQ